MTFDNLVVELARELNQTDLDERINRWVQQSIDHVYNALPTQATQKSLALTTTTSSETVDVTMDIGEIQHLRYAPRDGSGHSLRRLRPTEYFSLYADQIGSGFPRDYCFFDNKFYLAPIPSAALSLTLHYSIASVSIYRHKMTLTDSDTAAADGIQIYVDEDGAADGLGKLLFVSPTITNALIAVVDVDGHTHEITVYHDVDAATDGVAWYHDENSGNSYAEKNLFVSPSQADCFVRTNVSRSHTHFLKFIDKDNAAALGVAVYVDEDVASKTGRLQFVSPSDADSLSILELSAKGYAPPFLERYHEAVILNALYRGYRYLGRNDEMRNAQKQADLALGLASNAENRTRASVGRARPFSSRRTGHRWDSLRFPENV